VLGEFSGDAWHICWTPSEHPLVLTEELDECAFLCWREKIRHPRDLGWIRWVDLVFAHFFIGITSGVTSMLVLSLM
jgi:hypothetical protein